MIRWILFFLIGALGVSLAYLVVRWAFEESPGLFIGAFGGAFALGFLNLGLYLESAAYDCYPSCSFYQEATGFGVEFFGWLVFGLMVIPPARSTARWIGSKLAKRRRKNIGYEG